MEHSRNQERNETLAARVKLLSRLDNADWRRDTLIENVVHGTHLDRDVVEGALEQLEATGEVYTVHGEVRRTP